MPNPLLEHPAVRRVHAALAEVGASGSIVVLEEHARTAVAAAQQLGVEVGQIANSLIFAIPSQDGATPRPILILTSGAHRVDTAKVAAHLGVSQLERADPELVRTVTGFAIGGVAPVAHLNPVLTLVDTALADYETVWAAAGHARTVFCTTYDELVAITGGDPVEVA